MVLYLGGGHGRGAVGTVLMITSRGATSDERAAVLLGRLKLGIPEHEPRLVGAGEAPSQPSRRRR
jgi:hypothetical protein